MATIDERELAETALTRLRADEEVESDEWPPVARRFERARERVGLTLDGIAALLGIAKSEYWDIEFHDDEAFLCFSVVELRKIATILGEPLEALLFGSDFDAPTTRISFAAIAERLRALAATEGLTIEELGHRVGWELEPVMSDPQALGEFNLIGLSDVCHAIGVDWVTALLD